MHLQETLVHLDVQRRRQQVFHWQGCQAGRFVLGIECDGAMYHSSKVARDRDRLRQQVLEGRDIDRVIWQMIGAAIEDAVDRYVTNDFRAAVLAEWHPAEAAVVPDGPCGQCIPKPRGV